MYDIVTIGDALKDTFIKPHNVDTFKNVRNGTEICFSHGAKISVDEAHYDIGGSACNVAVGMSRLGFKSAIIGAIGGDQTGQEIIDRLNQENVDVKYLKRIQKNQSNFSIIIVHGGQRTVLVYRALKDYSEIKIPKTISTKWLYLGPVATSFSPNYKDIIRLASEKNINIAVNPGSRQIEEGRRELVKLLYVTKILFLNKEEAEELTKLGGFPSIKELLKRLKSIGPEIVIITDGPKGACLYNGENYYKISAYKTESIDPTGAGDAFSSGFLTSYINSGDIEMSLKYGIMNSSEVITSYGAQNKLADAAKIGKIITMSPDVYKE